MMGWVEKEKAAFLFVVFTNGAMHQYDYYINFIYNTLSNKFELDNIEFENYLHSNGKSQNELQCTKTAGILRTSKKT